MSTVQDDSSAPPVRFKRRKVAHSKRVHVNEDLPTASIAHASGAGPRINSPSPLQESLFEDDSIPNLKDIIRNRKRPRDRVKNTMRNVEAPQTELAPLDTPQEGRYISRFVAQTGQVVDRDDKQM
jgi:hypothetical protein